MTLSPQDVNKPQVPPRGNALSREAWWRSWWPYLLVIGLWLVYAAVFIWKSSFIIDGVRYFALFDDAMVSMTYARNLVHGDGLIWNAGGERVEGFSNPLWVGFMALVHLVPISMPKISLVVQVASALLLAFLLPQVRVLAETIVPGDRLAVWAAVVLTGFYYPLVNWSLLGTEVGLLTLITCASVLLAVRALDGAGFPKWLYPLLGAGTLVRIDGAIPMLAIMGMMFLFDARHRWDHVRWGTLSLFVFLGGQTVLRWAYYGDWLPNTYYLKMTGYPVLLRMARGRSVAWDFIRSLQVGLTLIPFLALMLHGDRKRWLLMGVVLAELAYSIYVGGDAWEHRGGANRFLATITPLFMIVYMAGWHELRLLVADTWTGLSGRLRLREPLRLSVLRGWEWAGTAGLVLVTAGSLLSFNLLKAGGRLREDLRDPDLGRLRFAALIERSIFVPGTERYTKDALVIREVTTPEARIAVVAAGNTPYFSERYSIDLLGKSDRQIAHQPARIPADRGHAIMFRPGHIKWDYAYSLGLLWPDVIVEPFRESYEEARPYLEDYESITINGHPMYFRLGSPRVIWSTLAEYRQ